MKKILAILMISAMCMALTACEKKPDNSENSSTPVSQDSSEQAVKAAEKTAAMLEAMTFPEMISVNSDFLDVNFGINADDLVDYSVYICPSGALPDEFGIFTATSAEKAAEIKTKVDQRIKRQTETYSTYTPDEVYKLEGSICELSGSTVIYAICEDSAKAREILK